MRFFLNRAMHISRLTADVNAVSTKQHVCPNIILVAYDSPAMLTSPGINPVTISTPSMVSTTRPPVLRHITKICPCHNGEVELFT